jgi:hypothetical protein
MNNKYPLMYVVALVIAATLISCSGEKKEMAPEAVQEVVKSAVSPILKLEDTISTEKFNKWVAEWAKDGKKFSDTSLIQYFDLPLVDLQQVLGENAVSSRFFLGLEKKAKDGKGKDNYEPHLLLAGVDAEGKVIDIYYDVSSPCPPICGGNK